MPKKQGKRAATAEDKADQGELNEQEALKAFGLNVDHLHTTVTGIKRRKLTKQAEEALTSNAFTADDEFSTLHELDRKQIINPPFNQRFLVQLTTHNNALMQPIAAMEVNVDGTGFEITSKEEVAEGQEPKKSEEAEDFFNEPWPNKSFITIRREMRRVQESTGNGYFEIVRNAKREIMLLDTVDATTIRLVRLDASVIKEVTLRRKGKEQKIKISTRERRFMQRSGGKRPESAGGPREKQGKGFVFFKEYGASRELNKFTGEWGTPENQIPAAMRASELMHFTLNRMPGTPYGIPRWINQVPSIMGSRKAEELNLDFFNSGGLPPAMIIVQGGILTEPVRQQIQTYLSGKGASKNRAMVLEVHGEGSMDKPGTVKVTVERFGSERQKDSMFEMYDEKSEKRVRSSFRLPPLFVGRTEDVNFASAHVSYMVAETQVFKPERDEFDEIMNKTIMKEIAPDFEFRSMPITLRNVEAMIKAVELAVKNLNVDDESAIGTINDIVNLDLKIKEEEEGEPMRPPPGTPAVDSDGIPIPDGGQAEPGANQPPASGVVAQRIMKMGMEELIRLSREWAAMTIGEKEASQSAKDDFMKIVGGLPSDWRDMFHHLAALHMMAGYGHDGPGVDEISKQAALIINGHDCNAHAQKEAL